MKNAPKLIISLLLFAFLMGCEDPKDKGDHSAIGDIGEVMIFSDEGTFNDYDKLIDSVFGPRIPQMGNERYFKVRKSTIKNFDGYTQKNYNLFILVHEGNWEKMKGKMNPKVVAAVEQSFRNGYEDFRLNNVFASPQVIYFVVAKDLKGLGEKLRSNEGHYLYNAKDIERTTTIESFIRTKIKYDSFYHKLMDKEGYAFRRPEIYEKYIENNHFYGISHMVADKHVGVYTYTQPFTGDKQFTKDYILHLRDSMLKIYIKGPERPDGVDTYMQTAYDGDIPVVSREVEINGHYAIETMGWWDMENDFMGGPFLSYTVYSEKLGKVITMEGNVFAPNRSKRRLLREAELIMHTFSDKK